MIRRFLTRILMVVLIAGCGYNWLQVRLLQAEVGDLKARAARQNRPPPTRLGPPGADWPVTEQELRRGANGLKNALDGARSPQSRRTLHALQAQTEQLREQADALWRAAHPVAGRHSP